MPPLETGSTVAAEVGDHAGVVGAPVNASTETPIIPAISSGLTAREVVRPLPAQVSDALSYVE